MKLIPVAWRTSAAILFAAAPLAGIAASPASAAGTPTQTSALPAALRPVLYQTLAQNAGLAYSVNADGCATLPKSPLKACFDNNGAHFTGAATPLTLHLVAWGRGETLSPVKSVRPAIEGNRVSYADGSVNEWWRVLPVGFEQGFTITKRPSGNGALTLALAASRQNAGVPTSRHSRENANPVGNALAWGRLRYGDLVVTDAKGKVVPATLTTKGERVLIAVNDTHAAYPLTVDPLVWLEQKVTANDGAESDAFGRSVVISGTTVLIGASAATVNGNTDQGAAYVFTESNGTWTQTQKLTASDGAAGDFFGYSVALDGTTALVGAPIATINGNYSQGAVYVFSASGGTWTQTQKLTASDGATYDDFGWSVAASGTTMVVGASDAAVNGNGGQGAAYVFGEAGGSWTQMAKLVAGDGASGGFGYSVAVTGMTAFISAPFSTVSGNTDQGAVYVFSGPNGTWDQTQKLTASDGAAFDTFGSSVAFDGMTALVGAYGVTVNGNADQGAAYVFSESNGNWSQMQKLAASDGAAGDFFGTSVAVSGATALAGAPLATVNGNTYQGAAYVFSEANGTWSQAQKFTASDGAASDEFGWSVVVSRATALVGATGVNGGQGAAYFEGKSNLGLAVSAPQSVNQGQQYTSQTIATNNSSAASPAVSTTITVPAAASFISATATQGSCSEAAGVVTCDFGPISANAGTATANVILKATGSSGTTIHNTASISKATPALTASAPTQITSSQSCPAGYTTYTGTLAANAGVRGPSYEAPAGVENAILYAPAGFKLYARLDNSEWGSRRQQGFTGTEVHRWGPAGTYAWGVKASDAGGAYTFCLMHP